MQTPLLSLSPATRVVLEIPDAACPSGYRVETPVIGELVAALAPAVVEYVAAVRAEKDRRQKEAAKPPTAIKPADIKPTAIAPAGPPLCPKCKQPKAIRPGGKNWSCRQCHSRAVSAGHAKRREEAGIGQTA